MPTLKEFRTYLAKSLNIYHVGPVDDAGDDWIESRYFKGRNWKEDAMAGAWVTIFPSGSNAPITYDNEIVSHNPQNGRLALADNGIVDGSGKTFEVFQRFSRDDLDFALMQTINEWLITEDIKLQSHDRMVQLTGTAGEPGANLTQAEQINRIWLIPLERADENYDIVAPTRFTQFELIESNGVLYLENRDHLWQSYWYDTGLIRVEYTNRYPTLHDGAKPLDDATFGGDLHNTTLRARAQLYNRAIQTATGATFEHMANLYRDTQEQIEQDEDPERRPATTALRTRW